MSQRYTETTEDLDHVRLSSKDNTAHSEPEVEKIDKRFTGNDPSDVDNSLRGKNGGQIQYFTQEKISRDSPI